VGGHAPSAWITPHGLGGRLLGLRLLLAEDDRIVRITVRDALEEAGYTVVECADGSAALAAVG